MMVTLEVNNKAIADSQTYVRSAIASISDKFFQIKNDRGKLASYFMSPFLFKQTKILANLSW